MKRKFTFKYSWILMPSLAVCVNFTLASQLTFKKADSTYLHLLKPKSGKTVGKNALHLVLPPIKPSVISTTKVNVYKPDDKLLNNVQVSNPITDQISLKYELSRSSNVNIKILDVLGNDVITLFSQRLEPGEVNFNYSLNNKLSRGFYFLRVVAGPESVIKRISVL